jgi:hypothetical protein
MAHHTGPRSTTQLALQRLATAAIDGRWTAAELAKNADCHIDTAKRFLASLVTTSRETVDKQVLSLSNDYRSTLELTAARSREYLQSISHLELETLDKEQRSLRKEALSSLTSLSSMLRLEVTSDPAAPPRLGNL